MTWSPRLDVLPLAQRHVWPMLRDVPPSWVLYGGTAVALRLGHRQSVDFDFFSTETFTPDRLVQQIPWATSAMRLQSEHNTLTLSIGPKPGVKVSFFGGMDFGRVGEPDRCSGTGVQVASLIDLAAVKMHVVQDRAEAKDYLDVAAILGAGITLTQALGAACAAYGPRFNPAVTLKALSYFGDGDLHTVPHGVQTLLADAAAAVRELPTMSRQSDQLASA